MNFSFNGRKVKFPTDEKIVMHFDSQDSWQQCISEKNSLTPENLIDAYKYACEKQRIQPIDKLSKQLENFNAFNIRGHDLILKDEQLDYKQIEALEEILKRIQFRLIDLEGCGLDEDGATALFEMIEYYESATHLNISNNLNIGSRAWEAFCRMLNKTTCLQHLILKRLDLNEKSCVVIYRALRKGSHLISLNLENSNVQGRMFSGLVSSLKENPTLRELFLGENYLSTIEAKNLKQLLLNNSILELLDVHGNELSDDSLREICDGLSFQPAGPGDGLKILNLSRNLITSRSLSHIVNALPFCRNLRVLDLSYNVIGNQGLKILLDGFFDRCTISIISLKFCGITCEGACYLAECLKKNERLKQIDLSGNNIEREGLTYLLKALRENKVLNLLELTNPRMENDEVDKLLGEIKHICSQNKNKKKNNLEYNNQNLKFQSTDDSKNYNNYFSLSNGDTWDNVSLSSINGTCSLSNSPRFSLSELFKPVKSFITTSTSEGSSSFIFPPPPPSTPNFGNSLDELKHSSQNKSFDLLPEKLEIVSNDVIKKTDDKSYNSLLNSFDSQSSYFSNSTNQNSSSDLRKNNDSPNSRFKVIQVDNDSNKYFRSNSVNETIIYSDDQVPDLNNKSLPINTSSNNRMMRSCSLGNWDLKNDRISKENITRSGRFSVSPVPDNEMTNSKPENLIAKNDKKYKVYNENYACSTNDQVKTTKYCLPKIKNQIEFSVDNLDNLKKNDVSPNSPSIKIITDELGKSNETLSEDNDYLPELTKKENKKISFLMPENSIILQKNRRMSTPAMPAINQQINKKKPKIPTLKVFSPNLNALDLKSSVPLSPTSLCKSKDSLSLRLNPDVEEFLSKMISKMKN